MGSPSFWRRLIEKLCPHRFSWPHTGGHGQDYQVCLICGSVYEYDCINMRRTGRLLAMAEGEQGPASASALGSRGV